MKMENFAYYFILSQGISFFIYFGAGWSLHLYFYTKRRHLAKEWKIQPNKWLSPALVRHEIMLGSLSLFTVATVTSFIICYIFNGNPCFVYFRYDEYGWLWFITQFPIIFLYMDYTGYISHRLFHTPWFYKHFHWLHHLYKEPTAFSVIALHPFESLFVYVIMCLLLFIMPVHWLAFYINLGYMYYSGLISHSGVNFTSHWWQPWQIDAEYHDKHHEFSKYNFGFNISLWDRMHGTELRKED